jgi:hypothetical protein
MPITYRYYRLASYPQVIFGTLVNSVKNKYVREIELAKNDACSESAHIYQIAALKLVPLDQLDGY